MHTGVKPSADASMTQAQPLGEDTLHIATDQEAGADDTNTGKVVDDPSVDRENRAETPNATNSETAADEGTSEAGKAAPSVALPDDQPAKPDPATADDDRTVPSPTIAPAGSTRELSAQATFDHEAGTVKHQPSTSAIIGEAASEQSLPAGAKSGAGIEAVKSATASEAVKLETGVSEITSEHDAASKDAGQAESNTQQDAAVAMDEDRA